MAAAALAPEIERSLGLSDGTLVRALAEVSQTVGEAREYAGLGPHGHSRPPWKEMFSEEAQRLYYAEPGTTTTSWDPPSHFCFADWKLDAEMYGISVGSAKAAFEAAHWLQGENKTWRRPAALLIKVLANIVDCGNGLERYRRLPLSNAKVQTGVWSVLASRQLLEAVGFHEAGGAVCLPADADLRPLVAALARLRRLADNKGHTGEAEFFPLPSDSSGPAATADGRSPLLGTAGYRYQERVFHCSECDHGINDGSERLFTGLHDAPKGEFRYECTSCTSPAFDLCEQCWDRLQSGAISHPADHAFQHHYPRTQRHNTQGNDSRPGASPWGGGAGAGASAGRALARMHERHGIHTPH